MPVVVGLLTALLVVATPASASWSSTGRGTVAGRTATLAAPAAARPCDAGDHVLRAPRMPIGKTVNPYETVPFSGASIGFDDRSTNQDACQGARVTLRCNSG